MTVTSIMPLSGGDILPALFGALLGGAVTFLTNWHFSRNRRLTEKRRLRTALEAELKSMKALDNWSESSTEGAPDMNVLSMTVYEQNSANLGRLNNSDIPPIVKFYSNLEYANHLFDERQLRIRAGEKPSSPGINQIDQILVGTVKTMKEQRETALERLSENN